MAAQQSEGEEAAAAARRAEAVLQACRRGDVKKLQQAVKTLTRDDIESISMERHLPHVCARSGSVDCLKLVLNVFGLDLFELNSVDADGQTPLHLAACCGHVAMAEFLAGLGADPNVTDSEGHSPLYCTVESCDPAMASALIRAGGDIAQVDKFGATVLHYITQLCSEARPEAAQVLSLLLVRADEESLNSRDCDGRTPLIWASSVGSLSAVRLLTEAKADATVTDNDGLTALHCAASKGFNDIIRALISYDKGVTEMSDKHGCTPLFYAAAHNQLSTVQTLLDSGANANHQDAKGRSVAHCAADRGNAEVIAELMSRKADLWLCNHRQQYPLHEALLSSRTDLALRLLDGDRAEGVDVSRRTSANDMTALHMACRINSAVIVEFLLKHSADVNAICTSQEGKHMTSLDICEELGYTACAKLLVKYRGERHKAKPAGDDKESPTNKPPRTEQNTKEKSPESDRKFTGQISVPVTQPGVSAGADESEGGKTKSGRASASSGHRSDESSLAGNTAAKDEPTPSAVTGSPPREDNSKTRAASPNKESETSSDKENGEVQQNSSLGTSTPIAAKGTQPTTSRPNTAARAQSGRRHNGQKTSAAAAVATQQPSIKLHRQQQQPQRVTGKQEVNHEQRSVRAGVDVSKREVGNPSARQRAAPGSSRGAAARENTLQPPVENEVIAAVTRANTTHGETGSVSDSSLSRQSLAYSRPSPRSYSSVWSLPLSSISTAGIRSPKKSKRPPSRRAAGSAQARRQQILDSVREYDSVRKVAQSINDQHHKARRPKTGPRRSYPRALAASASPEVDSLHSGPGRPESPGQKAKYEVIATRGGVTRIKAPPQYMSVRQEEMMKKLRGSYGNGVLYVFDNDSEATVAFTQGFDGRLRPRIGLHLQSPPTTGS